MMKIDWDTGNTRDTLDSAKIKDKQILVGLSPSYPGARRDFVCVWWRDGYWEHDGPDIHDHEIERWWDLPTESRTDD